MDKLEQEKQLEAEHYKKNDEIHEQYRGKPEFTEKIKELDKWFREEFMKIFGKKEEAPSN